MTRQERIGLGVIIALFAVCIGGLLWTIRPHRGPFRSPESSVVVEQRMKSLQQNK
jgi:hypothetical protein